MITAHLRRIAGGDPNAPALMGAGAPMSYAELLAAIARVRRLLERRGTQPGDLIVVSLPIGLEAVTSFFACVDLGAIFLPTNPAWRQPELSWLLQQAPPAAVIVLSGEEERWLAAGLAQERLVFADRDGWLAALRNSRPPSFSGGDPVVTEGREDFAVKDWPRDHPAACILSSGSTGRPKIVVKTQGGLADVPRCVSAACSIGPGHRLLATVPLYHASGLSNNLILPLLNGATLVLLEHFEPRAAAAMIEHYSVDYLVSSPVFYALMIDAQIPPSALQSLRVCLSSGAPLATSVREEWKRRYHTPIRQAYGNSDTGVISIQSEDSEDPRFAGRLLPMTEVRILAGEQEQACGEVGEIAVRGPGVVTRHLGDTDAPTARFWKDYVRTGDLGWVDDQGRLYLSSRLRPWINTGGVKVDPAEVQQVLSQMPGIRECLVEAAPGPAGREVVAAVIAPEPGQELNRADVIQYCRKVLAEYKIPRVLRFVPALAADLAGKIPKPWF